MFRFEQGYNQQDPALMHFDSLYNIGLFCKAVVQLLNSPYFEEIEVAAHQSCVLHARSTPER